MPRQPGLMGGLALTRVDLDPLVDLVPIRPVIGDCGLDQAERDLEILGRLPLIAVVVSDDPDGLPDIEPSAQESGTTAGGTVREPDQRMLVGAEPFLDVALRKRTQRDAVATRSGVQTVERRVWQAQAERLGRVAHCSTCHYRQRATDQ